MGLSLLFGGQMSAFSSIIDNDPDCRTSGCAVISYGANNYIVYDNVNNDGSAVAVGDRMVPRLTSPGIVNVTGTLSSAMAPNLDEGCFHPSDTKRLLAPDPCTHAPRILLLYGSLRERSYSRLMTEEAARTLTRFGAETKTFNPSGLALPDDADASHPKVQELRDLVAWCEGMVWCSPERHGAMTGIMKTQIDWIPLSLGAVRPTQGKTLAVMQVSGGSQSFNAVNQLRILGRWMRLLTIPNQSSTPKAFLEFDETGRMKPSPFYDRMVDVMEELMKFTLLTRDNKAYLADRYSERKETAAELSKRVNQRAV